MRTPGRWPMLLVVSGLGGALGFAAGRMSSPPASPGATAGAPSPAAAPSACAGMLATSALDPSERRAIADEVVARLRAATASPSAPERPQATPEPAPPSPEAIQAAEQLEQFLDRAFSAGAWTDEDVLAFRGLIARVSPSEREKTRRMVLDGIRQKRLAIRFQGPPM
jgi:hypothetical protein